MAVGSVVNAIAILRHLAASEPQGVNSIARAVGLNPSSCFNILKTLAAEDFLDFDPGTKTYTLGTAPARLFEVSADVAAWTSWIREELSAIASEFAMACGLWQVRAGRLVLIEVADSPLATRIHLAVGQRLPLHIGAMGRCIAALEGLTYEAVEALISQLRWQDPPSADDYWRDMELARARGWSIDDGNYLRGVTTIAAAIADRNGVARYCITNTLFSGQYDASATAAIGARSASLAAEAQLRLMSDAKSGSSR